MLPGPSPCHENQYSSKAGADPVKGHGCTHVHPIIFAESSKLGGLSNS